MKLYDQILTGLKAFFSLDADATETEIHDKLSTSKPLAEIQDGTAMADLQAQITALTAKVEGHETQLGTLQASYDTLQAENTTLQTTIEAHLATITEKETAITAKETELATLKASHKTQVDSLAGQIAALKAGKTDERQTETPVIAAAQVQTNTAKSTALVDPELRKILGLN